MLVTSVFTFCVHVTHCIFKNHIFRYLALQYSTKHADMANPRRRGCGDSESSKFGKQGGITNGAKWYSLQGGRRTSSVTKSQIRRSSSHFISGMQDFNYLSSNDFELTLELGCEKYPAANVLETEWERNRDALINFIWQVRDQIYH